MKQSIIFEGEVGDKSIDLVLPELIAKARELRKCVFLRWNGATIRIRGIDTVDGLLREYNDQLHRFILGLQEKNRELITMEQLKKKAVEIVELVFKKD